MKKGISLLLFLIFTISFGQVSFAIGSDDPNHFDQIIDNPTPKNAKEEIIFDNSFRDTDKNKNSKGKINKESGSILPQVVVDCGYDCGGSYSDPANIPTNTVDLYNIPLEYAIINGELIILKRPDLHYYTQNATQSWFNMVTGYSAKTMANGFGTFVTYKGVSKIPYVARLFDKYNNPAPYNYGDYAKTGSSAMIQYNTPFWGKIVSAAVPSTGTKTVLVYVSTTGANYSWHRRISFDLKPDGSITIRKVWVN
ncbi:hypothetical protein ACOI1C_13375 [Bacillus sp. DJP31]|uniref:hypothetical protein n=1 Tax=Bacillus sp. DJP31 TaxID=3409789 RepID=UPI003BB57BC0